MKYVLVLMTLALAACGGNSGDADVADEAADVVEEAMDSAGDAMDDAMEGAGDAMEDAAEGAGNMVDDAMEGAEGSMDDAMQKAGDVEKSLMDAKEELDVKIDEATGD